MTSVNVGRLVAVVRKELHVYRRSPAIILTMVVLPLVFLFEPLFVIFSVSASATIVQAQRTVGSVFLIMLISPAILPAVVAAYSVVGERDQGTLEPLLTTPIRREELLLGKAVAMVVPAVVLAYLIFGVIEVSAALFARNPAVAPTLREGPRVLAEILYTPLLAGWSTWVGIAISARSSDARVAQQLGTLVSLPPLIPAALMALEVVAPSVRLALTLGAALLVANVLLWRVVVAMFDRERLITGASVRHAD